VFFMGLALYLIQVNATMFGDELAAQPASAIGANQSGVVIVDNSNGRERARVDALMGAVDDQGNINRMVIDDVKIGTGDAVEEGDTVSVNYIGTFQGGQEFDNSYKRGQPFEFTVGAGQVITGWDEGVVGMKVGGERVLVIPPEKAYGAQGIGPIPGNATLVFVIELVSISQ